MRLWQAEATQILERGGKLRKVYWKPDTWMILAGVWFFQTVGAFGVRGMGKEQIKRDGVVYALYAINYNSMFVDEWIEVKNKSNAGFGLGPF